MDLFEEQETKDAYNKCKYIVKLWEHNFKKDHNRLPSKLDIREADKSVREAYKKYYYLKTAALEKSFKDVDGFNFDDENDTSINTSLPIASAKLTEDDSISEQVSQQDDNTWGLHLNKAPQKDDTVKVNNKGNVNVNTSITKKLFCGSKFTKRNPRKSQSFTQRKSEGSFIDTPNFLSEPTKSTADSTSQLEIQSQPLDNSPITNKLSFEGLFNTNTVKIATVKNKVVAQPTNIIQSVIDNKCKSLKTVDAGWLDRVQRSAGVEIEEATPNLFTNNIEDESSMCLDYNSDDIIDNSDEDDTSFNLGHLAKKPKLSLPAHVNVTDSLPQHISTEKNEPLKVPTSESNVERSSAANLNPDIKMNENNSSNVLYNLDKSKIDQEKSKPQLKLAVESNKNLYDFIDEDEQVSFNGPQLSTFVTAVKKPRKKKTGEETLKKTVNNYVKTDEKPSVNTRKSNRSTKVKKSLVESNSENEDPFHSDNDSNDPEFLIDDKSKSNVFGLLGEKNQDVDIEKDDKSKKKTPKRTRITKTKSIQNDENGESASTYELEYSVKPRISAPRFKNIKNVIKAEISMPNDETIKQPSSMVKSKRQQQLQKLEKKIESGNLNENYVTINLKKKIYCRGKKGLTFSKYKKQLWRDKKKALAGPDMDMGGCDGGMLTCFNCGKEGHFARNCTKTKGDTLLPLAADEEICVYPTLEEAAQMAKDSPLTIRKSNLNMDKDQTDKAPEEATDVEDDVFDDEETEQLLAEVLKIEEHAAKLDLQQYMDHVKVVEPYYKLTECGGIIETPQQVFSVLNKFGHSSFRPGQEQAIMRILSGKSTLVTLSTGSGKSLCYQVPAYLYSQREPCISLIVSPLVSLMEDQVTGIPSFLKAACLHTNQTKTQKDKIMEAIASGNLNVLLVSPEAVVAGERSTGFGSLLRRLPPIAFACIDEAHCVSQWSHNFRPSYLMICRVLREKMGVKTILGLTATATRTTSDSIVNHLQIPDGRDGIISDIPLPNNLILTVSKDHQRDQALLALITSPRFTDLKSIIIYCTRREECNRITKFLRTSLQHQLVVAGKKRKRVSPQAEPYHAGLAASKRRTIQKAFMSGELRIVVATVAFGMGINKSDIRAVIHYNMPKNFESYVQEIGRAGRDGLPAHCHLFLDARGNDENELRRHIHANSIDRHAIRKLLQKIFVPCSCKDVCPKHEVAFSIEETVRALDIPEENISTLLCYLELHEKNYIELLSPAYTICKVISYSGPSQIIKAAKECPPLAMALALKKDEGVFDKSVLKFAVVEIASAIGWDSGICKHKLKNLEWTSVHGQPKRSTLNIEFSNLGFRLLAPGNLSDDQLDEALDSLYDHVVKQEQTALLQLHAVHQTLVEVAAPSYKSCLSQETSEANVKLKTKIREYFESPNPLEAVTFNENKLVDEEVLVNHVHTLIHMYRDNNFTGRAIARIFHGISSPNYPAVIWGRCKFWRSHINVDFHTICRIATREILNFR